LVGYPALDSVQNTYSVGHKATLLQTGWRLERQFYTVVISCQDAWLWKSSTKGTLFLRTGRSPCHGSDPRRPDKQKKIAVFQIPVIERAIETAALILGSDRSRAYCLEMICADFPAGTNLDHGDAEMLLFSVPRFFKSLPLEQRQQFLSRLDQKA
jgi:hypothetical protein